MQWTELASWGAALLDSLNSNFWSALISALAGAFFGAVAARWTADRAKEREQLIEEIRAVKSSLELLFGMCNTLFNLKEQHVIDLKKTYDDQRAKVHEHKEKLDTGQLPPGTQIDLGMVDLRALDVLRFRTDKLEELVLSQTAIGGKAIPLLTEFVQSVETLNNLITSRNKLIEDLQPLPIPAKLPFLFGLPLPVHGAIDDRYGHYVEGIAEFVDHALQFSTQLADELHSYGKVQRDRFIKSFRQKLSPVPKLDFELARKKGLYPDNSQYASWQKAFIPSVPKTRGRRIEKLWCGCLRWWRPRKRWLEKKSQAAICWVMSRIKWPLRPPA